jgi:lactate dehydrogenase-like 2-hydroxyacid dehydrogenase|tara:strand:- start:941 stop:1915 length:975 start_codon:yes stop_codon:yes gene_type:complete
MADVFVSESSYAKGKLVYDAENAKSGELRFVAVPDADEEALGQRIREEGVQAFIARPVVFSGPLYEALGDGGIIVRFGVGHDGIDKAKAKACGVKVANTPGCLENAVAEQGLWLMGCLARGLAQLMSSTAKGEWKPSRGFELRGRTLAIVGFGRIGRRLGEIANNGFGMEVIGVGQRPASEVEKCSFARYTNDLEGALAEADFVAVCAAATDATRHLVDATFLEAMRTSAYLVNLARGTLVDEAALFDALEQGGIAGAGLDVFMEEPYAPVDPARDLRTLSNAIMTPHTASYTVEANEAMAQMTVETVRTALLGDANDLNNLVC